MWRLGLGALVCQAALAHEPGTLQGRVKDPTGSPLSGAVVEISGADLKAVLRTVTGADGSFGFRGLAKGRYLVQVKHPGGLGAQRTISTEDVHAATLEFILNASSATVEITGRLGPVNLSELDEPLNHLLGVADSASEGIVTPARLVRRPAQRPGTVLENIPGLVTSQHSGEGKANQYYLRGFNLDHGTDFSIWVAGVPVNLPSHAHGQGYSDLAFLIPELVRSLQFRKGPYAAEDGDFSAAGSARLAYVHALDRPFVELQGGSGGYRRGLFAGSVKAAGGDILGAVEVLGNEGPWVRPDAFRKANGVASFAWAAGEDRFDLTAMAYSGRWNATDQVPRRAVEHGLIGRFGSLDPTDGGASRRASLSGSWQRSEDSGSTRIEAYVLRYSLDLSSNFTFFLDDPVRGDQFQQRDRRTVWGLRASRRWSGSFGAALSDTEIGLQFREDDIAQVGLFHTQARRVLETVRDDAARQSATALYLQNKVQWSEQVRTTLGLRADRYRFDVRSRTPSNSGTETASLLSPKAGLVFGPWRDTELYLSAGWGFHSNDARGATLRVDPKTGDPARRATPIARARGCEFGLRSAFLPAWQATLALWRLDLGSELVFIGDAGGTEASRPSRRSGVEWSNEVQVTPRLFLDADLAWSRARFRDEAPAGNRIPGSVAQVATVGLAFRGSEGRQASLAFRHVGSRALVEDGGIRSKASNLLQGELRWQATDRLQVAAAVFNILDSKASDIDYFYASRLPGEGPEGVADVHTHPVEPRQLRLGLKFRF